MHDPWTIDRVKAELPAITVYGLWRQHIPATVRGRKNAAYATVHFTVAGQAYEITYAWQAIVDALNAGRDLRA